MDKNKISDSHLKQIRDRLFIAQRAYKTFSRCCQEIIRAANEKDLLHKVCEAIVKEGGYRLAWAGFAEHDKNKTVRPAAQAGYEEGYLDTLNITWADRERGWGPTGTAIRTGKPSIIKNILTDPTFAPWRPEAIRRGYESSISLPLIAGGQSFGALNIYAAEPDAFDEEEVKLLTELADELAYGITALRAQIEGKRAEERLKYSEKNYRELVENALVGVYKTNVKGEILFANEALARMLEFKSPEEMISTAVLSRYKNPKDREVLIENLSKEGKVSNFEFELLTKTGKTKNAILSATLDGDIISGMIRDITELKRAEKELAHTLEILRKSLWATTHAICMIVESRDPYTAGHQRRVSDLARAIATEMGLPGSIIDGIRIAALLHDIGKISVPSEILTKPGKLNENEFSLIKAHPKIAYEILSSIEFPWPIAEIILQHHERMDGSGYPQGLSGDDILIEARILGVADVVEAMVSHRPYRSAHKLEDVIDELFQKGGTLFDSKVTEVCLKLFKEKNFSFRAESSR